jgi:subtilisin family serine protease
MSHGTATLSICGGLAPGQLIGVAPRAEYALAKTEVMGSETEIEEDYWIAGLEWLDSLGCELASSSLGYTDWYTYADLDGNSAVTTIEADKAAARGLLVVNSAGNEGNKTWRYVIAPADGDSTLAVGATTVAGERVAFSSVGPTADGRIKPDVMAPGANVWSANPGSNTFTGKDGTSFSAPLVTGVCALLLQQQPALTPYGLIELLRETATNSETPDNLMGWGIVQATWAAGLDVANEDGTGVELWPNPMDDLVRIVLPASDPEGQSRAWIYTVSGQLVHTGEFTGHAMVWDGRNDDGGQVASGVYLVLVRTPVREETVKLAVLRRE